MEAYASFIFEDFVEIGLQYYYFEKFAFLPGDVLVYFNGIFMLLKAIEMAIRMIIQALNVRDNFRLNQKRNDKQLDDNMRNNKENGWFLASYGVILFSFITCITLYPLARAAGAFYQSARGNAYVKVSQLKSKSSRN